MSVILYINKINIFRKIRDKGEKSTTSNFVTIVIIGVLKKIKKN